MPALGLSICALHLIQQQRGSFALNRGCGEFFKCAQPTEATQSMFGLHPASVDESCRHTPHKPEFPLAGRSIIIKLRTSTHHRTFSSSLALPSFSSFIPSLVLASSDYPLQSLSNFPPAQVSVSSALSGCVCSPTINFFGLNYCSGMTAQSLKSHQLSQYLPMLTLVSRNCHCKFHFLHDS